MIYFRPCPGDIGGSRGSLLEILESMGGGDGEGGGEIKAETGAGKENLPQLVLLSHVCSVRFSVPGVAGRSARPWSPH